MTHASMPAAYRVLFEQGFTRIDPERAHHGAFRTIRAAGPLVRALTSRWAAPTAPVHALGLSFAHPLGLAAGFDKNAEGIDALAALGFSHIEVGTVTGHAQPGNPTPRLFRLPQDRAIVNRMGFNNDGAEAVAHRLRARRQRLAGRPGPVLGINIGKTKVVPDDDQAAVEADYRLSTRLLAPYADYLAVNVSSPNTPGLRTLQAVERLAPLVAAVRREADAAVSDRQVPLLVKIAPDLADEDIVAVAQMALDQGLDGIIATNTTIARAGLVSPASDIEGIGAGGLSGAPLRTRSLDVMRLLRDSVGPELCLIGVGGISTPADALERREAGATLVQAYTGFIYGGPLWPRRVAQALCADQHTRSPR